MTTCSKPATGANSSMWYTEESACGVTPGSPVWTLLRKTSGNMQLNKDVLSSNELDGSRDRADTRLGQNQTSGDLSIEMSYGSHDDLYASVIGGLWVSGAVDSGVDVAVDATAKTFTRAAGDFTSIFAVGDLVRFNDLTGGNSEPVIITAVSALVITAGNAKIGQLSDEASTTTDVTLADSVSIGSDSVSYSILEHYPDLDGGAGGYSITRGVRFTNLSYTMAVNAMNTGTLQTLGLTHETDAELPAGSTFPSVEKSKVYSGVDGTIYENGVSIGFINSVDASTDTEASAQFSIGKDGATFIEQGRVLSEFTLSTYFTDYSLLNKFISETETSLDLLMTSVNGSLMFSYPRAVYTSGAPDVGGAESITQSLGAQALQGINSESSIRIQRISNA